MLQSIDVRAATHRRGSDHRLGHGIVIATLSFFVINRLLPRGITFAGYDRAALETWTFNLVWLAAFGHAWWQLS